MLAKFAQASIAGIVFATIDRFVRPEFISTLGDVLRPFEQTRKLMFCDLGELDPRSHDSQLRIQIWAQMAGMERTRIKDRMVRGRNFKRLDPHSKTDPLPKGVVFKDGKFHYTPDAERVKEAFRRVLRGDSLGVVAKELKFSSKQALKVTMRSYWWIGVKASTKERRDAGPLENGKMSDGKKVLREQPIFVDTNLAKTPLVSREDFDAVQEILSEHRKTWTQARSRVNDFLGVGLLHCRCGAKMYGKQDPRPGKIAYYVCSTKYNNPCGNKALRAKETDAEIWWSIMTYFTDERFIATKVKEAMSGDAQENLARQRRTLERTITELERKKKNQLIAIENLGYRADIGERIKAIDQDLATTRQSLRELGTADASTVKPPVLAKQIKEHFLEFDKNPKEEQKRILSEIVTKIVMDEDGRADFVIRVGLPTPPWKGITSKQRRQGIRAVAGNEIDATPNYEPERLRIHRV
jgi:hypothetical protein